jgi:DNA-binding CsgD family transcriptional regulator
VFRRASQAVEDFGPGGGKRTRGRDINAKDSLPGGGDEPRGPIGRGREVVVDTVDGRLARDVSALLERDGWMPTRYPSSRGTCLRVVTEVAAAATPEGMRSVLVCVPTPFACAMARDALLERRIGAVVLRDKLFELSVALDARDRGRVHIDDDFFERAAQMPHLDSRQLDVLSCRMAGLKPAEVGDVVGASDKTVQRTMKELQRLFGVRSEPELLAMASRLGIPPWTGRASPNGSVHIS